MCLQLSRPSCDSHSYMALSDAHMCWHVSWTERRVRKNIWAGGVHLWPINVKYTLTNHNSTWAYLQYARLYLLVARWCLGCPDSALNTGKFLRYPAGISYKIIKYSVYCSEMYPNTRIWSANGLSALIHYPHWSVFKFLAYWLILTKWKKIVLSSYWSMRQALQKGFSLLRNRAMTVPLCGASLHCVLSWILQRLSYQVLPASHWENCLFSAFYSSISNWTVKIFSPVIG